MDYGLCGRVEMVEIIEQATEHRALGKLARDQRYVLVTNGNDYHDRTCLVRFRLRQDRGEKNIGWFISDLVPDNFSTLAKDQYILYAHHDFGAGISSLGHFHEFYQPGMTPNVIYLRRGFGKYSGKSITTNKDIQSLNGVTLGRCLRKRLPDPQRGARVVVVQDISDREKVVDKIHQIGLEAVMMELLK